MPPILPVAAALESPPVAFLTGCFVVFGLVTAIGDAIFGCLRPRKRVWTGLARLERERGRKEDQLGECLLLSLKRTTYPFRAGPLC